MIPPVIAPTDLLKTLIQRIPDLAGLLIALVMLFSIYQEQERHLSELQSTYYALSLQCAMSSR